MKEDFVKRVLELKNSTDSIYIYGAGIYGSSLLRILNEAGIVVDGFLVSYLDGIENSNKGIDIYEVTEKLTLNDGVIIGANKYNSQGIRQTLKKLHIPDAHIIDGTVVLQGNANKTSTVAGVTLEITTTIGCSVGCKYCPQDVLLKKYFQKNSLRQRTMTMETFSLCMDKVPEDCTVVFSGMAEPFLNNKCIEMIQYAIHIGRKVDVYSTLVGLDERGFEQFIEMPINFFCLHVADSKAYARIPTSDAYYDRVIRLMNKKKSNGEPFVDMCSAQTIPDLRVSEICQDKCEILYELSDRASHLSNDVLRHKETPEGEIYCSIAGKRLQNNILLPDGTILLCCMDYGMKHVLGNLIEQSYEDVMAGNEMKLIKEGLDGNRERDILCRKCSLAHRVCY